MVVGGGKSSGSYAAVLIHTVYRIQMVLGAIHVHSADADSLDDDDEETPDQAGNGYNLYEGRHCRIMS